VKILRMLGLSFFVYRQQNRKECVVLIQIMVATCEGDQDGRMNVTRINAELCAISSKHTHLTFELALGQEANLSARLGYILYIRASLASAYLSHALRCKATLSNAPRRTRAIDTLATVSWTPSLPPMQRVYCTKCGNM
jgi:hypothetical protein